MSTTRWKSAVLIGVMAAAHAAIARADGVQSAATQPAAIQAPPAPGPPSVPPTRPTPPTRDPHTPGYVTATELPDGTLPPPGATGNFIIGPTHNPAPEMTVQDGVPQGAVYNFTMSSTESTISSTPT